MLFCHFYSGGSECFLKSAKSMAEDRMLLMLFLQYWKKNGVAGTLTAESAAKMPEAWVLVPATCIG